MVEEKRHFEFENVLSNLRPSPLIVTIFQIASIWIVSDLSYQIIKNALDVDLSYNQNPAIVTAYYLFWILVTLPAFWNIYIKWQMFKNEVLTYTSVLFILGFIATYFIYILPIFPSISWSPGWIPPSELTFSSGWYFLPKSTEIILQQLLVSALAFSFYNAGFNLKTTRLWCAGLFGSAHLLLIFGGPSLSYAVFFTFCATVAGYIFPYFILKVKNGFMYSYMLHWTFYAVIVLLIHTLYKF
ncbi:MAG: hypothetical protein WAW92_02250 [Minisyncoccia bacterium]